MRSEEVAMFAVQETINSVRLLARIQPCTLCARVFLVCELALALAHSSPGEIELK